MARSRVQSQDADIYAELLSLELLELKPDALDIAIAVIAKAGKYFYL